MKALFDTNIVLDLLLDRDPFADAAARAISCVEAGRMTGYLCATSVTTIEYILDRHIGAPRARRGLAKLLSIFEVALVTRAILEAALDPRYGDFEDGVVAEAARGVGATAIVTRNVRNYKGSRVRPYSPTAVLEMLDAGSSAD